MSFGRKTVIAVAALGGLACLALAGIVIWRAERVLVESRRESERNANLGVAVLSVSAQPNPGFEAIGAPAVFKSAVEFEGRLYLSGPEGLSVYTLGGNLEKIYRAGMELPAAPLGKMAIGMVAGARRPEILIATEGAGVLTFDGQSFRQILGKTEETRTVTALLPLASGRLLIGTAKLGLLVFDGSTLNRFHAETDRIYVTALAGNEAELWIGTLNDGLIAWRGGQAVRIGEDEGLPDSRVDAIALAGDTAYAGTPMGVAELQQGKIRRVLAKGSFAHALMVDGDSLFVGQMEAGVERVSLTNQENGAERRGPITASTGETESGSSEKHEGHQDSRKSRQSAAKTMPKPQEERSRVATASIEEFLTAGGAKYALASDGFLQLEAGGEWRKILASTAATLTDRNISALDVAGDGRLWVGYFDRGLDIVGGAGGGTTHIENERVFCVNRIVEDTRNGAIAVATANGLVLFGRDGRERQVLDKESGLIAEHVTDVALYDDGMALATPAGITFLDQSGAHSIYAFQGLVNNHVYALSANGSRMLAGTLGGISVLHKDNIQRNFTTANSGLKHNWITAAVPAGDGWLVGTYGAGVLQLGSDGVITTTEATAGGTVVNPTAMATDGRLVLAGTLGRGLLVGDRSGERWRTVTAGLPSLNVTALAIHDGMVYVGTENGLVKIEEEKL